MAAPTRDAAGSYLATGTSTPSVAVPSGVASGSVITVTMFVGDVSGTTATVTVMPSGFAHVEGSPVSINGVGGAHGLVKVWKRATGADSGTYDFTLSGNVYINAIAERYEGCAASGDPWDSGADTATDTSSGTVTPAVNITTGGADRLVVFSATCWAGGSWTPPSGFTERVDQSDGLVTSATKAQASAGATGDVTATCTGSDKRTAWMGALKPAGGAVTHEGSAALSATATLTATAVREVPATASLSATATLTATAVRTVHATATLSADGTLTATADRTTFTTAALTADGTLTASAVRVVPASTTLAATGTLTAEAVRVSPAQATLTANGTVTATATLAMHATVTMAAVCAMTVNPDAAADETFAAGVLRNGWRTGVLRNGWMAGRLIG